MPAQTAKVSSYTPFFYKFCLYQFYLHDFQKDYAEEVSALTNEELRNRLKNLGINVGPVVGKTSLVYPKYLYLKKQHEKFTKRNLSILWAKLNQASQLTTTVSLPWFQLFLIHFFLFQKKLLQLGRQR